ncbi:chromate transporter, partial [Anaerotruncus colihominis]|uniref:chromate transporter n=1 Tax=Anaerotruncus colihominis TaxID=169435 RepID=UPI00210A330C
MRKLFFSTLYVSTFTFGGGFVIITFMKKKFVDELHWIDENEMLDLAALAQSSPGAIAVNAAILVGWRMAGFAGMLIVMGGRMVPIMAMS